MKQSGKIRLSVITASKPKNIGKSFYLNSQGQLEKRISATVARGDVDVKLINGVEELSELVDGLKSNQCLTYGVPKNLEQALLVPANEINKTKQVQRLNRKGSKPSKPRQPIARSREYFQYPEGCGVFMLDVDCPEKEGPLDPHDVLSKLSLVCPEFKNAPMIYFASSSSNIWNEDEKLQGLRGLRILIVVKKAEDIPRAGEVLQKKLWLNGQGFIKISRGGGLLVRTLIDGSVWQPERIDFCARANCVPPIEQQRDKPVVLNSKAEPLDTSKSLPELTKEENLKYNSMLSQAKDEVSEKAEEMREKFLIKKVEEEAPAGSDEVKRFIRKKYENTLDNSVLDSSHPITLSNGSSVTVKDLLEKPELYHAKYCCDPIEPEYNHNMQVAWINLKTDRPNIYSHAHGGRRFTLKKPVFEGIVDQLNKDYAMIVLNSKVCVLKEMVDPRTGYIEQSFLSVNDFKNLLSNRYELKITDGGTHKEPWSKTWLESKRRREYERLVFDPSGNTSPDEYNLFQGIFQSSKSGRWDKFKSHIFEVICGECEQNFKYLMAWMARVVQHPGGERPGVAIVLRGVEGSGKGTFVKYLGRIFRKHFLQINNQNQVTGRFNQHLKDIILLFVDEGFWAGSKSAEGVIKGFITEDCLNIEQKGKDLISLDNHMNIIISSNNSWVVPAGLEARRFFVLDVSDKHMQNIKYFKEINDEMENGGFDAFVYDLQNYDLKNINLREFPRTNALFDQIENSFSTVEAYWFERLNDGTVPEKTSMLDKTSLILRNWENKVEKSALYEHYLDYCVSMRRGYPKTKNQFFKELKKLCNMISSVKTPNSDGMRVPNILLPKLEVARKCFEQIVKMQILWDDPEDNSPPITELNRSYQSNTIRRSLEI